MLNIHSTHLGRIVPAKMPEAPQLRNTKIDNHADVEYLGGKHGIWKMQGL